jgi:hypothetical protein
VCIAQAMKTQLNETGRKITAVWIMLSMGIAMKPVFPDIDWICFFLQVFAFLQFFYLSFEVLAALDGRILRHYLFIPLFF